ncbi:MAG: hypothetical protein CM1200mP8_3430 [Chloroflexota bacterium]|jgi:hypothetical protein|nr:MAG: hypothetical protein CM1200mP8_3430 [Chloroflexota bacterium]
MAVDLRKGVEFNKLSIMQTIMEDRKSPIFRDQDLRGLTGQVWSIYGNNIGPFLILTITGMLPVLLISYFIGNNVPGLLALSIIEILIVTTLAGAFIYSVPYYYVNGRVNLQTSLKASQSVYFKLLVVTLGLQIILAILLTFGVVLPLLIIPFIGALLYMIYFVVTQPVVVIERLKPIDAFKRSLKLVRGNWWRVFGATAIFVLTAVGTFVLSWLPFYLISLVLPEEAGLRGIIQQIGVYIGGTLTIPPIYIFLTVLYYDLRYRKEDFSFEQLSDEISY